MTTYNSDDIKKAEEVLATNLGLSRMVTKLANSLDHVADFHTGDDSLDLGTLLIAAARRNTIHFMQAHTVLTEELRYQAEQRGEQMPYDSAVQTAYEILDEQGVITDERIAHFREQVIPKLAEDLGVPIADSPKKEAPVLNFYEEREKQKGRA